jgi:tol-pal system protein YbgF
MRAGSHLIRLAALLMTGAAVFTALPATAQDASEMLVRMNRMENDMRRLSGEIERLQFENRRLTDQLRKFQEDVDFRLNERSGQRSFSPPSAQTPPRAAVSPPPSTQIIDEPQSSGPRPLDLGGRPTTPSVAAAAPTNAKEAFDQAMAAYRRKAYEDSEMGFRQFLQSYPRDARVADATYWLGESYAARARHREAAEQFLKVSTTFPKTRRAPDSLLKLGVSLNALGSREQACATFAKLEVEHPQASDAVKQGTEREKRRARCV